MSQTPEITYPCRWKYQVVGTSEEEVRAHVASVVGGEEHELVRARESAGGKYVSLHLTVVVGSEAKRLAIGERLAEHDAVRIVI